MEEKNGRKIPSIFKMRNWNFIVKFMLPETFIPLWCFTVFLNEQLLSIQPQWFPLHSYAKNPFRLIQVLLQAAARWIHCISLSLQMLVRSQVAQTKRFYNKHWLFSLLLLICKRSEIHPLSFFCEIESLISSYIIYQINYVITAAWIFTTHLIILFKMMYTYSWYEGVLHCHWFSFC